MSKGRGPIQLSEWQEKRVHIFPVGLVHHPYGNFEVTEGFFTRMLASHNVMKSYGYLPSVFAEHEADGTTRGVIWDLEWDPQKGIYALVRFRPDVFDAIGRGEHLYVSPSFYEEFMDPHTGAVLFYYLCEVSLVSAPHLKNLEPLSDFYTDAPSVTPNASMALLQGARWTLHETGLMIANTARPLPTGDDMSGKRKKTSFTQADDTPAQEPQEPTSNAPEDEPGDDPSEAPAEVSLDAIGAMLDERFSMLASAMGEMFKEYMGEGEPASSEEGEEGDEPSESGEGDGEGGGDLAAQLSEARRENPSLQIQLALGEVSEDLRTQLMDTAVKSPKLFSSTLDVLKESRKEPGARRRLPREAGGGNQAPTQNAPQEGKGSMDTALEKAREFKADGGKRGTQAIAHVMRTANVPRVTATAACKEVFTKG